MHLAIGSSPLVSHAPASSRFVCIHFAGTVPGCQVLDVPDASMMPTKCESEFLP